MVLDGVYKAPLLTAFVKKVRGIGSGRVFLTLLGGGVFSNEDVWITASIARAVIAGTGTGRGHHPFQGDRDYIVLAVGSVAILTTSVRDDIKPQVDRCTRCCDG